VQELIGAVERAGYRAQAAVSAEAERRESERAEPGARYASFGCSFLRRR